MKKYVIFLLAISIFFIHVSYIYAKNIIPQPSILKNSKQLILVITNNWQAKNGKLQLFKRNNIKQKWVPIHKPIPIFVGQTGLAWSVFYKKYHLPGSYKKEGDNKSPAGAFPLKYIFGFNPLKNKNFKLLYIPIKRTTVCVCDPNSKFYNQIVNYNKIIRPDWRYHEVMQSTEQYRYGIVIDYNQEVRIPGSGSCVFMHIWDKPNSAGTAGCTAMSEKNIIKIITWLKPSANPVLVQIPIKQYKLLKDTWKLPNTKDI